MYLGLDIGTSAVKALLWDGAAVQETACAPLSTSPPGRGASEQDPEDWWRAVAQVCAALRTQPGWDRIGAIGLSGQMHGAVCLGADGAVLRPAMLWNDNRAVAQSDAMTAAVPGSAARAGVPPMPGFTAPKVEWVRLNEPDVFEKVAKVLLPKDYLRLFLSGAHVSEMSDASGKGWLDIGARDWSDTLLAHCHLSRDHMPRLVEGSAVSATLRADLAAELGMRQVPIAGGAGDNAAAAMGAGVVTDGTAVVSLGTSGVLFDYNASFRPKAETAEHTFCHAATDTWHQMGVILAATDALEWLSRLTGQTAAELTSDLGDVTAPQRTLFLPYLGGERTPINNPNMRGQFLHLDHATDAKAAARAVMQGVCYAFADCRDALAATGTTIETALALGGGSQSDHWVSMMASTLGMTLQIPQAGDYGAALGAARLGMMAATGGSVAEIATPPPVDKEYAPDPALQQAMQDGHKRYKEAYQALKNL